MPTKKTRHIAKASPVCIEVREKCWILIFLLIRKIDFLMAAMFNTSPLLCCVTSLRNQKPARISNEAHYWTYSWRVDCFFFSLPTGNWANFLLLNPLPFSYHHHKREPSIVSKGRIRFRPANTCHNESQTLLDKRGIFELTVPLRSGELFTFRRPPSKKKTEMWEEN